MAVDLKATQIVRQAAERAIETGGEVGLQVAAYLHGELVIDVASGVADPTTRRTVDSRTLFNVFSVVKPVTATAVHIQVDRGLVDYDAPIARYWPEFAANGKGGATVRDALTHRTGIPQMPESVTPELMADYDWMIEKIAALEPIVRPGTSAYHSISWGWINAEIVRRTDPRGRPFAQFVEDEICKPLDIESLFIGIPEGVEPRVARIVNAAPPNENGPFGTRPSGRENLLHLAIPTAVGLRYEVYGRPDVRRACIPGAGGIMNAQSAARFFAMLAGRGELDGTRIISPDRWRLFTTPRSRPDEPDPVAGQPMSWLSLGGSYSNRYQSVPWALVVGRNPNAIWHIGAGSSVAWADPDAGLAVAICHNRMFYPESAETNPFTPIAEALRTALGVTG